MKKIRIVQMAILIAFITTVTSCGPGFHGTTSGSIVISSGSGFGPTRSFDGRFYYRSPQGFTYWRGWDGRYYVDRRFVRRVPHSRSQRRDWRRNYGKFHW